MLQTGEIIIIAILALVVLGPQRLPDMARKIGGWMTELRKAAREITSGLEAEVNEFKEVGRDLKGPLDEVKKPLSEIRDDVKGLGGQKYEWKGPKPVSGPTPEDAMRDYEEMQSRLDEAEEPSAPDPSHPDAGEEVDSEEPQE